MTLKSSLRSIIYQTEKIAQLVRFASVPKPQNDWPILLGMSFPKSGTHLLDQILLGFSKVAPFSLRVASLFANYDGETGRKRGADETLAWLNSLRPRDIASSHLFSLTEAVDVVCTPAFVPYFIYRDPRDIVVSHVFYVTDMETNHVQHAYFKSLPDFNTRLKTSILGRPDAEVEFFDIGTRFKAYSAWLDQPSVLQIHFEDLINDRTATLTRIMDHFLARVPLQTNRQLILDSLETSINPKKSPTFRSGKTGEWKKHFTDEHKKIFKEVAGDLLVKLGYEKDNDW
ncbi:MAG: sulfotransferase domain-containing protein [Anaerolineales bacterium]